MPSYALTYGDPGIGNGKRLSQEDRTKKAEIASSLLPTWKKAMQIAEKCDKEKRRIVFVLLSRAVRHDGA